MPIIKIQYCLNCQKMDHTNGEYHLIGEIHGNSQSGITSVEWKECFGPFAECPPPDELEENWQDNLPALSPGEYYLLQGSHISYDVETDQNIILELI